MMRLKLYCVVGVMTFFPISGLAGSTHKDANNQPSPFPIREEGLRDGFYIGLQGGYDSYNVLDKITAGDEDVDIFNLNPSLNANGWLGGLFAGYGHYFPWHLYLGTEAFVNSTQAKTSYYFKSTSDSGLDVDIFNTKFQVKSNYGIALLPGIKINSSLLLYAHLGWNWLNFKTQQTFITDQDIPGFNNEIDVSAAQSGRIHGFSYGLGMESSLFNNFSLRGEFIHTHYVSFSSYTFFTTPVGADFSVSDNEFLLGLVYHLA